MTLPAPAAEVMARLSVEERVGQLLIPRPTSEDPPSAFIERLAVGGFIVDRTLYVDPRQMAEYIGDAQAVARARGHAQLFITCDQEGGHITFMKAGATAVPPNMGLAATGDARTAREAATILAEELRAVGVNWDFAPVVDVNTNPENPVIGVRSYSDDPRTVSAFAREAIAGFQGTGLLACAKHFPGHGDTELDSHVDQPVIRHARERLDRVELEPFRASISAGVASVMTAHVRVPALDPERIGTLSSAMLTTLLRGNLGFEGLVVTDAMDMAGVAEHFGDEEAAVETIRAGADVILTRRGLSRNERTKAALVAAVRSGEIPSERFDSAVRRVVEAKTRLAAPGDPARVGNEQQRRRALELARRSITLLRASPRALPLPRARRGRLLVISPVATSRTLMETSHRALTTLGHHITDLAPGAREIAVEYPLSASTRRDIETAATRAEVIVVGTLNAVIDPDQVALLESLRAASARLVVIAMRTPYDLMRVPWVETFLCAYSTVGPVMRATAEVLFGERAATGMLPIEIPGLYPRGSGLQSGSSAVTRRD